MKMNAERDKSRDAGYVRPLCRDLTRRPWSTKASGAGLFLFSTLRASSVVVINCKWIMALRSVAHNVGRRQRLTRLVVQAALSAHLLLMVSADSSSSLSSQPYQALVSDYISVINNKTSPNEEQFRAVINSVKKPAILTAHPKGYEQYRMILYQANSSNPDSDYVKISLRTYGCGGCCGCGGGGYGWNG